MHGRWFLGHFPATACIAFLGQASAACQREAETPTHSATQQSAPTVETPSEARLDAGTAVVREDVGEYGYSDADGEASTGRRAAPANVRTKAYRDKCSIDVKEGTEVEAVGTVEHGPLPPALAGHGEYRGRGNAAYMRASGGGGLLIVVNM